MDINLIKILYNRYKEDILSIRSDMKDIHTKIYNESPKFEPQFDDIESELTYLFLRHYQPKNIIEFSPGSGWSTCWILKALNDNKIKSKLFSFDLISLCKKFVPKTFLTGDLISWEFFLGDVKTNIKNIKESFDYVFIDSDHSASFGEWYINNIFNSPKFYNAKLISVHDVFHSQFVSPKSEGAKLIEYLKKYDIPYFTSSKNSNIAIFKEINEIRKNIGILDNIHTCCDRNSAIFFSLQKNTGEI